MSNVVPQQHPALQRYLAELELHLKRTPPAAPEEGLADAREFLLAEWETLQRETPRATDEEIYQHFIARLGPPAEVAAGYAEETTLPDQKLGYAPGWRLCCTKCGRSTPAAQAGIVRVGAKSRHKYILGYCRQCRWLRFLRLTQDLDQSNLSEALENNISPEQLREEMHQPVRTIVVILVMTAAIILAVWGVVAGITWLIWRLNQA